MFRLRLVEESDLVFVKDLRENPLVSEYLGTFALINDAMQKKWFDTWVNSSSSKYLIFEREDGVKAGMVRLSQIDFINRSICVGGDLHPDFQNQGLSAQLYTLIFDLVFNKYNMHRAYLLVLEENKRAIRAYEKQGFKLEGLQRDAICRNGKYHNYLMYSKLAGE